jgi:hypothetical protein
MTRTSNEVQVIRADRICPIRLQHPAEAVYCVVRGSGIAADDTGAAQSLATTKRS